MRESHRCGRWLERSNTEAALRSKLPRGDLKRESESSSPRRPTRPESHGIGNKGNWSLYTNFCGTFANASRGSAEASGGEPAPWSKHGIGVKPPGVAAINRSRGHKAEISQGRKGVHVEGF